MKENQRIDQIRAILIALTAPRESNNTIMGSSSSYESRQKRGRRQSTRNCSTFQAKRGKKIYRGTFLAIPQISDNTLQIHAADVASSSH